MDRGTFQAKINELVVAANTRRSDGAAQPDVIELSLTSADRLIESLKTVIETVRYSTLSME